MADLHVIDSPVLANLRDAGGVPAGDGHLRRGVLLRSAPLTNPSVATDPGVISLNLGVVVDLRTAHEAAADPDVLPAHARYLHLDVLADQPQNAGSRQTRMVSDPASYADVLATYDAVGGMVSTYRGLVTGVAARQAYASYLRTLIQADGRAVLVHCTAGKDRTGWAVAVAMTAVGVSSDEVRREYLAVNPAVRQMFRPLLDGFAAHGGDPSKLAPMLEVRPEYLAAALDEVEASFGGFAGYLHDGLGLSDSELAELRGALVA